MLGATQQLAAIPTVLLTQNANNVCTIKPSVELTKGKKRENTLYYMTCNVTQTTLFKKGQT